MRQMFSRQLVEARHEMLSIFESVDLNLHDAITAFVQEDKTLANKVKKNTLSIDARCANLEAICYNLIATQSPMASDLRLLQFIIFTNFNLERLSNHVRGIARGAKRAANTQAVPEELLNILAQEAEAVYQVMGATISAIVNNDLDLVSKLDQLDDPVDAAYKNFYRTYNHLLGDVDIDEAGFDYARRSIMSARYLERMGDICVEVGARVAFMLTGQRWTPSELSDLDDFEEVRIPSGEGRLLNSEKDAAFVAAVPSQELDDKLAEIVDNIDTDEERDTLY